MISLHCVLLSLLFGLLQVSFQGMKLLCDTSWDKLSDDDRWYFADALLLSFLVPLLGVLCIACFFIDTKSPMDWTIYNVRNIIPGQPILRDLAAVSMAMLHFSAFEFLGLFRGIVLWHYAVLLTVFFASFVSRIIEKNETPTSTVKTLRTARAWPVVVFGLRYGFLFSLCGVAASVNAVTTLQIMPPMFKLLPPLGRVFSPVYEAFSVGDADCFIRQISPIVWVIIAGLVSAVEYRTDIEPVVQWGVRWGPWWMAYREWAFALAVHMYFGLVTFMEEMGRWLGEINFHSGTEVFMNAHRTSGATLPNIKPTHVGLAVFWVCAFQLLCVAFA